MPRIHPLTPEQTTPAIQAAFEKHIREHRSRITNMKSTMGRSPLAFDIYMRWYDLYEEVKQIVGNRAAYLFAHAISSGSNCPLCTTYFRKLIIDNGEKPEQLQLTEREQELLDFGSAIAVGSGRISDELYEPIRKQYSETEIVVLTCFAGQMIATNVFSNIMEVEIDDYLATYTSLSK